MKKLLVRSLAVLSILTLLFGGLPPQAAHATVGVVVTSSADGPANTGDCPSASNCTLRDAIAVVNAGSSGSGPITFSGVTGTITLTNGQLELTHDVTITGPGAGTLAIDANSLSRVFQVDVGVTATITDLTLKNGAVDSQSGGAINNSGTLSLANIVISNSTAAKAGCTSNCGIFGGAIYSSGPLSISGASTLSGNSALSAGGAIFFDSATGALSLSNLTVFNNSVTGDANLSAGGGLYLQAALSASISGTSFQGNTAGLDGGGVFVVPSLTITNSTFVTNAVTGSPGTGGGLASFASNTATVSLTHVTFTGNSAPDAGGGVEVFGGTMIVDGSSLESNSTSVTGYGGGLNLDASAVGATIKNTTLTGNSASVGGAVAATGGTSLLMYNSTVQGNGNSATAMGGGLYNNGASVTLINDTFSANQAPLGAGGGGLYQDTGGTLRLSNTILANSPTGGDCTSVISLTTDVHNLIVSNSGCGTPTQTTDPQLAPLDSNGGPTQTMGLIWGSPAIDNGDDTTCSAADVNNLDQRGFARPRGSHCDIGAYERIPPVFLSDFEGDKKSDPAKFYSSAGTVWWLKSSTAIWDGAYIGTDATSYVPASDFDGDGKADPAKWLGSSHYIWYLQSTSSTWNAAYMGTDVVSLLPAMDFEGDRKVDPTKYIATGYLWYFQSTTSTWNGTYIGTDGTPLWGSDYDGDGKTDPAKYIGAGAIWYLSSLTGDWNGFYIGTDGTPVPASDFDGDGKTDPAKFLSSSNTLWYLPSTTHVWQGLYLGPGTLTYLPGCDFDGDGKTDPATFNPSTGAVWYWSSKNSTWVGFGLGGDTFTSAN